MYEVFIISAFAYVGYKILFPSVNNKDRAPNHLTAIGDTPLEAGLDGKIVSPLFAQMSYENRTNYKKYLAKGNEHADIALQSMFIKQQGVNPPKNKWAVSDTISSQVYQQTLPGDQRSLFNINFSRVPSANPDQRPGFLDSKNKSRYRL